MLTQAHTHLIFFYHPDPTVLVSLSAATVTVQASDETFTPDNQTLTFSSSRLYSSSDCFHFYCRPRPLPLQNSVMSLSSRVVKGYTTGSLLLAPAPVSRHLSSHVITARVDLLAVHFHSVPPDSGSSRF